jgi:hypothetical protein
MFVEILTDIFIKTLPHRNIYGKPNVTVTQSNRKQMSRDYPQITFLSAVSYDESSLNI